ncbi:MAG: methylmalonyl Co-A mutase-associated GTPase MeaB [Betaproteobacteria bacterium]|nr:methylmalonyl Co-A mutase-associated GTPase MeaB [Betaproteobacteria bacterium]
MNESLHPLIKPLLAGNRRAIARAITAFEAGAPEAASLATAIAPHLGRAHVIGITGAPGAGKSTLINALLGELLARSKRVGVVAVDPSSPISGGAVLGDRVRMAEHGSHESVFVRSVASRGHLGGLSRATSRIVDVMDAAGFDTIIVETVGAGQSEVEIAKIGDTRIVICPPGLGDGIQAIKAGILEIADILVVNKGDSPLAARTARDLQEMLHLRRASAPKVAVLVTTATTGEGVPALVDKIAEHRGATGVGTRLRPHAEAPSVDDVAAVDAALRARDAKQFHPTPVTQATVATILAAAHRAVAGHANRPWRIRALAGEPLGRLLNLLVEAGFQPVSTGATAALIFTADHQLDRGDWLEYGMFVLAVLAAARARGVECSCRGDLAPYHEVVETALGLGANEVVVFAAKLGYTDVVQRAADSPEPGPEIVTFAGFDR